MEDILKIYQTQAVHPDRPDQNRSGKKKHKRRRPFREAKKHLEELTKVVKETHKELETSHSPFRLCIYQEGEDIYIDVVTIDETGKTSQVFRHDVSHTEIENLVQQIKSGTGLLLNKDI